MTLHYYYQTISLHLEMIIGSLSADRMKLILQSCRKAIVIFLLEKLKKLIVDCD